MIDAAASAELLSCNFVCFFFAVVGVCGIGSGWILLVWPISVADDVKADLSFLLPDKHVAKLKYWHVKLNWKLELKAIFFVCVPLKLFQIINYAEFSRGWVFFLSHDDPSNQFI